jgi:hypothetical protein
VGGATQPKDQIRVEKIMEIIWNWMDNLRPSAIPVLDIKEL